MNTNNNSNIVHEKNIRQFVYKPYYYPNNENPYYESVFRRVATTKYSPKSYSTDTGFDKQYYFIDEDKIEGFSKSESSTKKTFLFILLIILITVLFVRTSE